MHCTGVATFSKASLFGRREDTWLMHLNKHKTYCFGLHSSEEWHLLEQQPSCNNEWGYKVSNSAPTWPMSQHCKPWVAKIMSQLPRPYPAACLSAVRSCFQTFLCKQEGWKLLLQEWKLRLVLSLSVSSWALNTSFTFVKRWINQESWQAWGVFLCWFFEGMESKLQPRIWTLVGLKFSLSLLKLLLLWNIFWT